MIGASRRRLWLSLAAVGLGAFVFAMLLRNGGLLQSFDLALYDWSLRHHAEEDGPRRTAVIAFTDADFAEIQYPVNDKELALVIERVLDAGALAVGVDILRQRPLPPGAPALTRLMADPRIVWATKIDARFLGVGPADRGARETGFIDLVLDPTDQIVRRSLLFARDGANYDPSFALKLALYWPGGAARPRPVDGAPDAIALGEAVITPLDPDFGGYVGTDASGHQFALDYRDGPEPVPVYARTQLLSGALPQDALRDRIVVIGNFSEDLKDFVYTPFTPRGDRNFQTAGAVMHAEAAEQILRMAIDGDPPIRALADHWEILATLAFAGLGVAIALLASRPWIDFLLIAGVGGAVFGGFHLALGAALWIPPAAPATAFLAASTAGLALMFADTLKRSRTAAIAQAAAEAETAAKSTFLATVSHEIRTPMNGVVSMLELLQEQSVNADAQRMIGVAKTSADGLIAILNDILDASKIEAGELTIETIAFDAFETVEAVGALFAARAAEKGLALRLELDPTIPISVIGDPTRVKQVLTNLVGNAVKFTTAGTVAVRAVRAAADHIDFQVADTGVGLSAEQAGRLFHRFGQADASTTRKFGGTGLGLSICRDLVTLMQGEIGVDSAPGVGSTFAFQIPLPAAPGAPALADAVDLHGLTILAYAEDAEALSRQLAPAPVRARAGLDAFVAMVSEHVATPVVMVADSDMPEADLTPRRLSAEGLSERGPTILLAGARTEGRGFDQKVMKPAGAKALRWAIARAVGRLDADAPMVVGRRAVSLAGKALVIDDMEVNRIVARRQFAALGVTVDVADSAKQALDAFTPGDYAIVFVDLSMPEMDGFDCTRAIRQREQAAGAPRAPVICFSGFALQADDPRLTDAGIDDVLIKPAALDQVADMLRKWAAADVMVAGPDPAEAAPGGDVIDVAAFARAIADETGEMTRELLPTFADSIDNDLLGRLAAAEASGDRQQIHEAAHAFVGLARGLGARALETSAKRLQDITAEGGQDMASPTPLIAEVRADAAVAADAVRQHIAALDVQRP